LTILPVARTIPIVTGRWFIPIALLSFVLLVVGLWSYLSGSREGDARPNARRTSPGPWGAELNSSPESEEPADVSSLRAGPQQLPIQRAMPRSPRSRSIPWRRLAAELAQRLDDAAVRFRSNLAGSPVYGFVRGQAEMQAGDYLAAIEHFDGLLAGQPDNVPAALAKANALVALGRFTEAVAIYDGVIHRAPGDAAVRYDYGILLCRLERFAEAAEQFRALVRVDPQHARGHYNLAIIAQVAGRLGEARDAWQAFARLRPDSADGWFNLGVVWMDFDQPLEAAWCFLQAIARDPDAPGGHLNLGLAYAAAGHLEAAFDAVVDADELAPCEPAIMRCLAGLHEQIYYQGGPDAEVHLSQADLLREQIELLDVERVAPRTMVARHPEAAE
jgi:tetratricopeptide (TPR) repeat protein